MRVRVRVPRQFSLPTFLAARATTQIGVSGLVISSSPSLTRAG